MEIRRIQDINIENKKVIFRVGLDVSIENGHAREKFKIEAVKKAADYLMEKGAKVAIMTYLGRPEGKKDMNFSVSRIKDDIEQILGYKIIFVSDCIGEEVAKAMAELKEGEMALLENVRFYPGEGSVKTGEKYDDDFAKQLSQNFDIFVNDAFSQSHRSQASISGIPKFIPGYAGLLLQEEINEMEKVRNNFERPAVAIIGGAKIETKLPVIKTFEKIYDNVLVGGKIANEALDQKIAFGGNVLLPIDLADEKFDIGPKTIERYKDVIKNAKTIVWNGPMGKFEEEKYAKGTQEIFRAIMESDAFTLVGGGETLELLEKDKAFDKFGFVSTGGGAMLEYLSGKPMPGIESLSLS